MKNTTKRKTPGQAALEGLFNSAHELSKNWKAINAGLTGVQRRRPLSEEERKHFTAVGEFLTDLGHNVWLAGFPFPTRRERDERRAQRKARREQAKTQGNE